MQNELQKKTSNLEDQHKDLNKQLVSLNAAFKEQSIEIEKLLERNKVVVDENNGVVLQVHHYQISFCDVHSSFSWQKKLN